MAISARGAGILLSTLSGLSGNRPLAAKPALIFFGVNALSLAGLYSEDYNLPRVIADIGGDQIMFCSRITIVVKNIQLNTRPIR